MSKFIMSILSFLLVLQLIIPYSTFASAVGEFTSVVGNATQTRAKEVIIPVVKSTIEPKDLIVTARTSSSTMGFSDDGTITLSENTQLGITFSDLNHDTGTWRDNDCPGQHGSWCTGNLTIQVDPLSHGPC